MPPTADLDDLSHADPKGLVLKLLEDVADLRRTVASQRARSQRSERRVFAEHVELARVIITCGVMDW